MKAWHGMPGLQHGIMLTLTPQEAREMMDDLHIDDDAPAGGPAAMFMKHLEKVAEDKRDPDSSPWAGRDG